MSFNTNTSIIIHNFKNNYVCLSRLNRCTDFNEHWHGYTVILEEVHTDLRASINIDKNKCISNMLYYNNSDNTNVCYLYTTIYQIP